MRFRDYLIVMIIATAAAWSGWMFLVFSLDPTKTGNVGMVMFYVTLAFAVFGTLSVIGTSIRALFKRQELVYRHVTRSLRQSILLTLLVIGCLVLLSRELFTLWTAGLFMAFIGLVEMAFLSSQFRRDKRNYFNSEN